MFIIDVHDVQHCISPKFADDMVTVRDVNETRFFSIPGKEFLDFRESVRIESIIFCYCESAIDTVDRKLVSVRYPEIFERLSAIQSQVKEMDNWCISQVILALLATI